MGRVGGYAKSITIDASVSPAAAYSDGDQLGELMTLSKACRGRKKGAIITSLTVIDYAAQEAAIDLLFFSDQPTIVSSDNAALNISDADLLAYYLGSVQVTASDYTSLANNSVATIQVAGLYVESTEDAAIGSEGALYAIAVSRGTPTYVSEADLQFKVSFSQNI